MALADNRPAGFDYMRLVLALAVVALHFVVIDYGGLGKSISYSISSYGAREAGSS